MCILLGALICVNCRLWSKAGTVDKELPFGRVGKHRTRLTLQMTQHSHGAAHLDTEEGSVTSLAAARKGVTCNRHLSSFDAGVADEGRGTHDSQGSIPSRNPGGLHSPPPLPAHLSRRVTPLHPLNRRCHYGNILP